MLIKILQIGAVPKIVWSIALVCSITDFIPILVKMNFYGWVIFDVNARNLTLHAIMSID